MTDGYAGMEKDWYKDAVIYEIHVKTFCDGNGDGIGDFKGMLSKLDYLEDLGITAVWLLPFYPSPLRDDGYDIADYRNVHPDYGTLADFKKLLREAHARNIKVITELVLNHTSDQHIWFQRSRRAKPGTKWRDFYVWSDTPKKYEEARIIFQDFEHSNWAFDPGADAYYWHRFYYHQPDLNFENPQVHKALLSVLDFWFGMGVDGMRLDAVPYLYEEEGTNCENLPRTYEFLKKVREHVDKNHKNKMLLAEANQWPEDAAAYFGKADMCHMAFHFPLMPRMFMGLQMENKYPILDILDQTPEIPDTCQWALFLRNHDELTLEMVTDEERDYMYRIYAADPKARINLGIRRRLAPLLGNDRRKIELMNVLLFTLPGSPVIYYGDEIGMGDNYYLGDRDGVRTPMQWSPDKNSGFSKANPQQLYLPVTIDPEYHYEAVNVETQYRNQSSLLWWMRRMLSLRNQYNVFGRGEIQYLKSNNSKVLIYVRKMGDDTVLVATNLSRYAQVAEPDLSEFAGHIPEDLFSKNRFPVIDENPYRLMFGAFGYFLFYLHRPEESRSIDSAKGLPKLKSKGWAGLFEDKQIRTRFEKTILPRYMKDQRWFGGKARRIRRISVLERPRIGKGADSTVILMVEVEYVEGSPEIYILPLSYMQLEPDAEELPQGAVASLEITAGKGVVYEAVYNEKFCLDLLEIIAGRRKIGAEFGKISAGSNKMLKDILQQKDVDLHPELLGADQSNTSIRYGNKLILKLYRRTDRGAHPDVEIVKYLTEKARFEHIPPFAGALEFQPKKGEPIVIGLMQQFIPNQGDAWKQSLEIIRRYYDRALSLPDVEPEKMLPKGNLITAAYEPPLDGVEEHFAGETMEAARMIGMRTGEMHLALAGELEDASFKPERFTQLYRRSLFQSMQNLARNELRLLKQTIPSLSEGIQEEARAVVGLEKAVIDKMRGIVTKSISTEKTRIHGDYHLGQVLFTGKDFYIFDFEGEPARSLSERRLKRSPIRDVAGMIRSYHYAAYTPLLADRSMREEDVETLSPWADLWYRHVSAAFLRSWLETVAGSPLVPEERDQLENILVPYILEKAVYEMSYELNNRPELLIIPLRGIKHLCGV